MTRDEIFMQEALSLARQGLDEGEVPVGAVVVLGDRIIGRGFNRRESGKNALCHAELSAIDEACRNLGGWRLINCELFVTLEPCPMCAGAAINSRIKRVVYGTQDSKAGSCGSVTDLFALPYNHKPQTLSGVLEEECSGILREFFAQLRAKAKERSDSCGVIICAEGTLWDESGELLTPDTKDELNELRENHKLLLVSDKSREEIAALLDRHALTDCFEGYASTSSSGMTKAECIRTIAKRYKHDRYYCIGSKDADRKASETSGVPFFRRRQAAGPNSAVAEKQAQS